MLSKPMPQSHLISHLLSAWMAFLARWQCYLQAPAAAQRHHQVNLKSLNLTCVLKTHLPTCKGLLLDHLCRTGRHHNCIPPRMCLHIHTHLPRSPVTQPAATQLAGTQRMAIQLVGFLARVTFSVEDTKVGRTVLFPLAQSVADCTPLMLCALGEILKSTLIGNLHFLSMHGLRKRMSQAPMHLRPLHQMLTCSGHLRKVCAQWNIGVQNHHLSVLPRLCPLRPLS